MFIYVPHLLASLDDKMTLSETTPSIKIHFLLQSHKHDKSAYIFVKKIHVGTNCWWVGKEVGTNNQVHVNRLLRPSRR